MKKDVIAIELDGVLCDLESYIVTRLEVEYGDVAREARHVPIYNRFKGEVGGFVDNLLQDRHTYRHPNPDKGAVKLIEQAIERGYFVLIISERDMLFREITDNWIERTLGRNVWLWDGLGYIQVPNMVDYLKSNKDMIEFFVSSHNIVESNQSGVYTIAWRQPWNDGIYPCLDVHRDGTAWFQPSGEQEGGFIWEMIGENNE